MTTIKRRNRPMLFDFLMLTTVWLLLTNSYTFGNLLLAFILAYSIPVLVSGMQTHQRRVLKPLKAAKYLFVMLWDIFVSNMIVAKQVLGPMDALNPGFLAIPLDIEEPLPITLLASTISLTPGTVSTEISEDQKTLYVHALHVDNERAMIAEIKERYETPLKEIFGC